MFLQRLIAADSRHVRDQIRVILPELRRQPSRHRSHEPIAQLEVELDSVSALEELEREQIVDSIDALDEHELLAKVFDLAVESREIRRLVLLLAIDRQ